MREIKFRVWKKYTQKYLNADELLINLSNGNIQNLNGGTFRPTDVVLEQYTGLKDFNGAEIYEGDILQDVDDSTIVGIVEYDEAFGEYDCGDNNLYECTRDCVVIGNIHKNADLLEEQ